METTGDVNCRIKEKGESNMFTVVIHALLLAFGLILPLGVQNVFVFNQGANQRTIKQALPVVVTASVCDTILILVAVLGVSAAAAAFSFFQTPPSARLRPALWLVVIILAVCSLLIAGPRKVGRLTIWVL